MEEIIGTMAATLTTISFVPQAIKIIRSKHTADISLSMYIILNLGISCWLAYGIMLDNFPMMLANGITLPLTLSILYIKIKFG